MISKKIRALRSLGFASSTAVIGDKLLRRRSPSLIRLKHCFEGAGLEIGGPSKVFSKAGYWPVYACAARVDNVNFCSRTEWHGTISGGHNFQFDSSKAPGLQIIRDAGDLHGIDDGAYDFVLSSHMLEHSANPMKVLIEWKRVLKPGGMMQLVLPHRDGTFDHRRPVTTLEHLREDFANDTKEDDPTHFEEILRLHDLSRDPGQTSREALRSWILDNVNNRGAHHHVFTSLLVSSLVDAVGFELLAVEPRRPFDIFVTARKPITGAQPANGEHLSPDSSYLVRSPFPSDRCQL